jgi:flagellar motor switch protein FliM
MSNKAFDNLTSEKIKQLLSAVGSVPKEEDSQTETAEHNWSEPHYFSSEQLKKISFFTETLAAAISKKFTDFCRGKFEVTIVSAKQYFANDIIKQYSDGEQKFFYLPFDSENGRRPGILGMTEKTAIEWTKLLLGDTESQENAEKELSQLEKSLLLDLASAVVRAFSQTHSSFNFSPANNLVSNQWPLETDGAEPVCQIVFNVKQADAKDGVDAFCVIPCGSLDAVAGKTKKDVAEISQENISRMIMEHIEQTSVKVTAQLSRTELSFEDMMNLQVDDILLLDKKVTDFVELIANERTFCYGWPVQSGGRYAVAVAETAFEDME